MIFILSFLLASTLMQLMMHGVSADATLELLLLSYSNPTSTDWNGRYCDAMGVSMCDHIFQLSLSRHGDDDQDTDEDDADSDDTKSCFWKKTSGTFPDEDVINFGTNVAGIDNPIVHTFSSRWLGSAVLKVDVTDDDGSWSNRDDEVDKLIHIVRQTPATGRATADWKTVTIPGSRKKYKTSLLLKLLLYCNANYYSKDCSVHCAACDTDAVGHYTCDPATGNKVCRPGWEDTANECKTPCNDCVGNSCQHGATCVDGVRSYTCQCQPGYTGRYCESIMHDDCQHGECHPSRGNCSNNNSPVCQNGGSCEHGVCRCSPGFVGVACDVVLCDLIECMNGGTCNRTACDCRAGFTGRFCEVNVDDCVGEPCQHDGTCDDLVDGFQCRCLPGFSGLRCQDIVTSPDDDEDNNDDQHLPDEIYFRHVTPLETWFYLSVGFLLLLATLNTLLLFYVHRLRQLTSSRRVESTSAISTGAGPSVEPATGLGGMHNFAVYAGDNKSQDDMKLMEFKTVITSIAADDCGAASRQTEDNIYSLQYFDNNQQK